MAASPVDLDAATRDLIDFLETKHCTVQEILDHSAFVLITDLCDVTASDRLRIAREFSMLSFRALPEQPVLRWIGRISAHSFRHQPMQVRP
jgi:hypothetical protein